MIDWLKDGTADFGYSSVHRQKYLLHRADFGSLLHAIYKELGDLQNMIIVSLGF